MASPFTNFNIAPSLEVMSSCIQQTNESYQRLLGEPESLEFCAEAGKSLRLLSRRYTQVLIAIVDSQSESELDDEEWEDEEGRLIQEELED